MIWQEWPPDVERAVDAWRECIAPNWLIPPEVSYYEGVVFAAASDHNDRPYIEAIRLSDLLSWVKAADEWRKGDEDDWPLSTAMHEVGI